MEGSVLEYIKSSPYYLLRKRDGADVELQLGKPRLRSIHVLDQGLSIQWHQVEGAVWTPSALFQIPPPSALAYENF